MPYKVVEEVPAENSDLRATHRISSHLGCSGWDSVMFCTKRFTLFLRCFMVHLCRGHAPSILTYFRGTLLTQPNKLKKLKCICVKCISNLKETYEYHCPIQTGVWVQLHISRQKCVPSVAMIEEENTHFRPGFKYIQYG
jgi:hypothetical protein